MRFLFALWFVWGLVVSLPLAVAKPASWEVVVLFLGGEEKDPEFAADIDRNLLELSRGLRPSADLKITVVREFPERIASFFVDVRSPKKAVWDGMFQRPSKKGVFLPGEYHSAPRGNRTLLVDDKNLGQLLSWGFRDRKAKRLLLVYGHGFGFRGLRGITLEDFKDQLAEHLPERPGAPPLDLLWLDACFMANLEALYELRGLSSYFIGSEESEFTAGAPFASLAVLNALPTDIEATAATLAEKYIQSYSYTHEGEQRSAVLKSSATTSVVNLSQLGPLVDQLARLRNSLHPLKAEQLEGMKRSLDRVPISMEGESLVDLGSLLLAVERRQDLFPAETTQTALKALKEILELPRKNVAASIPTLRVHTPNPGDWLVYGYEDWKAGHQKDEVTLAKLPKNLTPEWFVQGRQNRWWPARAVNVHLDISPFGPGLSRFHYYFVSPSAPYSPTSEIANWVRSGEDWTAWQATRATTPLRYFAVTHGTGKEARKYTGISVLDPSEQRLPIEYSYLDFAEATRWESLLVPNF